jgi:hypothetical protein
MRWAWHVACIGEGRGIYTYTILVGKPEGKRPLGRPRQPLGRPRHRWDDNIKADLQEVGCGGKDWIELAQDTDSWRSLGNAIMNLQCP